MNNESEELIIDLINQGKSWKSISNDIDNNDLPILCYYAILKKAPLKDFNEMIQGIYQKLGMDLSHFFCRFFDYRSTKITIIGYQAKDDNKISIYDKIFYVFYDKKSNVPKFDKQNLPYLLAMLKNVTNDNVASLHESKFSYYLSMFFSENIMELKPIFNINNPAFNIKERGNFAEVNLSVAKYIFSDLLYEKTYNDNQMKEAVETFKLIMPNFKEIVIKNIFNNNLIPENQIFKVNSELRSIAKYLNINLFEVFNKQYETAINQNLEINHSEIDAVVSVYFDIVHYSEIDFNTINLNKNINENYIYYSFLKNKIKSINSYSDIPLNKEVRKYFLNVINDAKDYHMLENMNDKEYKMLLYDINIEMENDNIGLKEMINAQDLADTLVKNPIKSPVVKI